MSLKVRELWMIQFVEITSIRSYTNVHILIVAKCLLMNIRSALDRIS